MVSGVVDKKKALPKPLKAQSSSECTHSNHSEASKAAATSEETNSPRAPSSKIQRLVDALQANFAKNPGFPQANRATTAHRTSGGRFRGVTRHKRTNRFEAHIWHSKKQIYLGGFDFEASAAKSHDVMALHCKGPDCDITNFPVSHYVDVMPYLEGLAVDDVVNALRLLSKSQTAARLGLHSPSPVHHRRRRKKTVLPSLHSLRSGGIEKRRTILAQPLTPAMRRHLRAPIPPRRRKFEEEDFSSDDDEENFQNLAGMDTDDEDFSCGEEATDSDESYNPPFSLPLCDLRLGAGGKSHAGTSPPRPKIPKINSPRRGRNGICPGAIGMGSPRGSTVAGGLVLPSAAQFSPWVSPPAPQTPHANPAFAAAATAQEVAKYDCLDLNTVVNHLAHEPSLTYSANEESYLFESIPIEGSHTALEHLAGAVLLQPSSGPETATTTAPQTIENGSIVYPATLNNATPFAAVTTGFKTDVPAVLPSSHVQQQQQVFYTPQNDAADTQRSMSLVSPFAMAAAAVMKVCWPGST